MDATGRARRDPHDGPGSSAEPPPAASDGYHVGEVARLARITVRTLHHYDAVGLLVPSGRSGGGYRRYSGADLERLHQILLFRELGFALEAIRRLLEDPAYDRRRALEAQRALLIERRRRTDAILRAVEGALRHLNGEGAMSTEEMFEGFDDFNRQHEAEVEERWGDSDAYEESMRRAKGYTKEDWKRFRAESEEGMQRFVALLEAGASATSVEAMDTAETARQAITRWFYDCSPSMHRSLADMYEADPRFTATYEERAEGLAAFVAAAIRANADRQEG